MIKKVRLGIKSSFPVKSVCIFMVPHAYPVFIPSRTYRGWSNSSENVADPGSISRISNGPLSLPEEIPECRVRVKLGMQKNKTNKTKK